jgi:hypothetical protein
MTCRTATNSRNWPTTPAGWTETGTALLVVVTVTAVKRLCFVLTKKWTQRWLCHVCGPDPASRHFLSSVWGQEYLTPSECSRNSLRVFVLRALNEVVKDCDYNGQLIVRQKFINTFIKLRAVGSTTLKGLKYSMTNHKDTRKHSICNPSQKVTG